MVGVRRRRREIGGVSAKRSAWRTEAPQNEPGAAGGGPDCSRSDELAATDHALAIIATDPERVFPVPDRECEQCGEEIPDDRGRRGARATALSAAATPRLNCADRSRRD